MKEKISELLAPYWNEKGALIPILQHVQGEFGYLPEEAIGEIATALRLSESEIYGVATFYAQFRFVPLGEWTIKVCQGTACHVRGSHRILDVLQEDLGIQTGETTADQKFSLERIACFGSCSLAPVMVINESIYGRTTITSARKIINDLQKDTPKKE